MKRILVVFMWLFCFLLLVGCSQNQSYTTCTVCGGQVAEDSKYCSECGESISEPEEQSVDYTILDSGICNSNVSWEIRSDGVLYISGRGTVPNYNSGEIAPWRVSVVSSEIKTVIISDGITGVGQNAFHSMVFSSLYFGHNVITYESNVTGMYVETVYIPKSMKNAEEIFFDLYDNCSITVYYEGTKDEWEAMVSPYSYILARDNIICEVNYNYEY